MILWVSDTGAIVASALFGLGLGFGIIGGAEIGRIIHRAGKDPDDHPRDHDERHDQ